MSEKVFSPVAAQKAQAEYCKQRKAPLFAPPSGVCWRCKRNIYEKHGLPGHNTGISVEEAGSKVICYCPHCNRSYDD